METDCMDQQTTNQFKKRLTRDTSKRPTLALNDRDLLIFGHLYRTRLMSADHIAALVKSPAATEQPVIRRLQKLFEAGYLDRPRYQMHHRIDAETGRYQGLRPLIYALGKKGAQVVGDQIADARVGRLDWIKKNRELGVEFLEHGLLVADMYTLLQLAIREANGEARSRANK